ncbi:ABC transporter substrate-binding protein [Cucumibacter marinus]|uniref:ABC transporter substrate-binding protein n=1 Tax=Cucumibacter marinus TaxID=1121252 RepID=UPI00138ABD54|nr:extracellular solute-binding protein [Cucumibacter marinus]
MSTNESTSGPTRRSVLKGMAATGAGAALASGFGIRMASAQANTLKVMSTPDFKFADALAATEEPEMDGTYLRAAWHILQNWKEKHPEVTLEFDEVPWDQVTQNVILAAQAGTENDVVMVNDLNIPKLSRGGFLMPIDQFSSDWDDYNQNLLRGIASYDGNIYALPWMTDCRHEYYRKSLYSAAGISDPASTWDGFVEQMKTIKESGVETPYSFFASNSVHTPTMSLLAPLWMLGGNVIDAEGRAVLNSDEMAEVFAFYNRLMNEEGIASPDLISLPNSGAFNDLLASSKVAAQKNGAWVWSALEADGHGDDIGFFRTPRPSEDAPDATLSGFWAFELPARTGVDDAQQELAAEFALHVTSAESQNLVVAHIGGQLPTRPSVNSMSAALAKDDAWRFQASYAADAGRGMPPAADSGLLFDQMTTAFQRYLSGQQSAQDALTAAENNYNSQVAG